MHTQNRAMTMLRNAKYFIILCFTFEIENLVVKEAQKWNGDGIFERAFILHYEY